MAATDNTQLCHPYVYVSGADLGFSCGLLKNTLLVDEHALQTFVKDEKLLLFDNTNANSF